MFKKTERLSRSEFSDYFQKGTRQHFTHFTIITSPHDMPKVSVVVGKKVAKSAVRRNALRRRVYAQLKNLIETTGYKGVLIIIVKPSYNAVPRKNSITALTKAVTEVFTKLTS